MPLNYESAKILLETAFVQAEADFASGDIPNVDRAFSQACQVIFSSNTKAYREVLLGCVLARIQDKKFNIRQPYVNQGPQAFHGRELDQRVVNPFFHAKRIPSTVGPYLSLFRRSVQFTEATRQGVKDTRGYDQLLVAIGKMEFETADQVLGTLLGFLLYKFLELREAAHIDVITLHRVSLEQYDSLISGLLGTPSQGRFPVILLVATFKAIGAYFDQDWVVEMQGINQADSPAGAGGDITVKGGGQTVLVAEVTERPVDISRVVTTFQTKIAPYQIEEYLFFVRPSSASPEARRQAHQYFAQGHEVNFLEIKTWMLMALATMGRRGRQLFNQFAVELLGADDIPRTVKVAWNNQIERLTGQ